MGVFSTFFLIVLTSVWFVTHGTMWNSAITTCTARVQRLKLKWASLSLLLSPGSTANLTFPQWRRHNTGPDPSFTFESIFNFSLFHSQTANAETLSPAKISFWHTMQWIKGHTWLLSCSLGDQTHFQGQELLTGLFNPQGETRNLERSIWRRV